MTKNILNSYLTKRDTARGIVVKDGNLLLIDRTRPGMQYYSTPGGGIESGETPERAAKREMNEETSLELRIERKLFEWHEGIHVHHFYLFTYVSGIPCLREDAEENINDPHNMHTPRWVSIEEAAKGSFRYWEPVKEIIIQGAQHGFSENIKIITTNAEV